MAAAARVVVVGAGIVGATAAWQLARRGVQVDLVEAAETGPATSAGAGHRPALAAGGDRRVGRLQRPGRAQLAAARRGAGRRVGSGPELARASAGSPSAATSPRCRRWPRSSRRPAPTRGWTGLGEVQLLPPGRGRARVPGAGRGRSPPSGPAGSAGWTAGCSGTPRSPLPSTPARSSPLGRAELVADGDRVRGVRVGASSWTPTRWCWPPVPGRRSCCAPLGVQLGLAPMRGQIVHLQRARRRRRRTGRP